MLKMMHPCSVYNNIVNIQNLTMTSFDATAGEMKFIFNFNFKNQILPIYNKNNKQCF